MKKLGLLAFAAVSGSAFGFGFDVTGGTGAGAIPDSGGGNVAGDPLVITLTVSGNAGALIDVFSLSGLIGAEHTWAGDLLVTMEHAGVTIDLMDRNYRTTTGASGFSGDLDGNYMFDEGATLMTGTAVTPGTYGRHSNPTAGVSTNTGTYADLVGTTLDGTYTFTIIDHWVGDEGLVEAVRIVGEASVPVPEPATMAVLGLGALVAMRRRRN